MQKTLTKFGQKYVHSVSAYVKNALTGLDSLMLFYWNTPYK